MLGTGPGFRITAGAVVDGKFRIERVLGEGAMGVVVRALHKKGVTLDESR